MRIKDSVELAWNDWQGSAQFDRVSDPDGEVGQDAWAVRWARAYVEFAAGRSGPG
jgi:predicted oxidoreductase